MQRNKSLRTYLENGITLVDTYFSHNQADLRDDFDKDAFLNELRTLPIRINSGQLSLDIPKTGANSLVEKEGTYLIREALKKGIQTADRYFKQDTVGYRDFERLIADIYQYTEQQPEHPKNRKAA